MLFFLTTGFVVKACLEHKGKFPTWALGLVALMVLIGGVWYYGSVAGGSTLRIIASVIPTRPVEIGPIEVGVGPIGVEVGPVIVGAPKPIAVVVAPVGREHTPLMKVALGLDFFEVDFWGKVFRIFQFITQLSLIVGLFMFLRKKGYYIFAGASVLILAVCVLIPGLSALLNATRFYHLSLLTLAPAFVLGGGLIFRSPKTLVLCLMVPYFLFTSGLMFEITGQESLNTITMPYSIALSDHRIDLGGGFTKNDELVRDWIIANGINHIYSDHYGTLFLYQYLGSKVSPLPERGDLSEGAYVFLRERSIKDGIIVHWAGVGLRSHVKFDMNDNVIYQVGESKVVRIEK
ncbi:MAG: hypothetical protein DDT40_01751 [candidate division WS2 bacterium]|nr:hypothetical protein [Candidatus Psychracetigena formicireducens]